MTIKEKDIPKELTERIDITRKDIYPGAMIARHIYRYQWAVEQINKRFTRAGIVADFGCGTGYGSQMLLAAAHRVLGFDGCREAILTARKLYGGGLMEFIQGANSIQWSEASLEFDGYDAVVSIESLEHVEEPVPLLRKFHKHLIDNGLLVLSTPDSEECGDNPHHLQTWDWPGLHARVTAAGFTDIKQHYTMKGFLFLTARRASL